MQIGQLWQDIVTGPLQPHSYSADNAFYSAAWDYPGHWGKLHDAFIAAGGDGFYAAPLCPPYEPALLNRRTAAELDELPDWPNAWNLQQRLVVLKTHYTLEEAKVQAGILHSVIEIIKCEVS